MAKKKEVNPTCKSQVDLFDSAKPNGIHTPLLAAEGPFEYNSTKKGRITKCQKAVIFMDRTT